MGRTFHRQTHYTKTYFCYSRETVKQFNIASVLPMKPNTNHADLKHDMQSIQGNEVE